MSPGALASLFGVLSCGRWRTTEIKVSLLQLVVFGLIFLHLEWPVSALCVLSLTLAQLIHTMGHCLAVRWLDLRCETLVIWPAGETSQFSLPLSERNQLIFAVSGPLANMLACLLMSPSLQDIPHAWSVLKFWTFPLTSPVPWSPDSFLMLVVWTNWLLFVINLFPAYPLDGSWILHALLSHGSWSQRMSHYVWQSCWITACVSTLVGLAIQSVWLVALSGVLVAVYLRSLCDLGGEPQEDRGFPQYDFSAGYTSLERSSDELDEMSCQDHHDHDEELRESKSNQLWEEQLDALLAKVHEYGLQSLTLYERRLLQKFSREFRMRGKHRDSLTD